MPPFNYNPDEPRTHCIRCGTCCMKGGPTLHWEDAALFKNGILKISCVYTIRKGEMVYDNIRESFFILQEEIIKIKGKDNKWTCMFYNDDQKACTIYQHRPIECRLLKCWDTRELEGIFLKKLLQRKHLISPDDPILEILAAHERRCSYVLLEQSVKILGSQDSENAVKKVLDLLQYDYYFRPFIVEKLKMGQEEIDFLFGRPLVTTISMFGLQVEQKGNTFWLIPDKPKKAKHED